MALPVAHVRPRTSKGMIDLLLPNITLLSAAVGSAPAGALPSVLLDFILHFRDQTLIPCYPW
ncbi:hypothetical protein PHYBLDRAFT_138913 [Phycomyces blakesleeanus NRRL 1555(-)]|uniref:Uncharacterized protein n=1 Tax=Phycomyces blakesleeanus (strain ATCC 8743b / DSM 1359 / FGSC 10004 / NBRC 33097 / NRRL 1555) TaxID=763407 RepID=A0A167RCW1_PHYB8|nr:hypothetical protein PHYBLDRAFT_152827 [Phycomyces blakesleeanus NRRL 1555(-)]XP_018299407.1 hypothetical protein PHYBLDRAFT_138913 [Phycomyces blakesleeanus NRRL 1555(-)]OAD66020.1 hypothetical protein PHYBLDRAFT_152827 [Phycomyces blakesleeanus NRRL 1555(-)]OAD81367.1 hypothetical protein PHYBLDRAFT_138913 [Phycomyces blakesleeanus NRRL 1555(-)]|eukprot:XP_018284060.1 hypothetical protein PHYBLDRAFT_152827 [Phycomyces blakesleeanus NRRL 1555(-)]